MSRSSRKQPPQPDDGQRRSAGPRGSARATTGTPAGLDRAMMGLTSGNVDDQPEARRSRGSRRRSPDRDDAPPDVRVEFVVLDGPTGQELRRAQAQVMRRVLQWIAEHRNPRQPVDDTLVPTVDDGGHEDVLSFLEGIAVANQPTQAEAAPVMVPVAFAARVSDKDNQDPTCPSPGSWPAAGKRAECDRFVRFFGSDLVVVLPGDQAAVLRSSSGSARRRCWNPCQRSAGCRRPGRHHLRHGSTWMPSPWQ